jgi:hypothetical protein
VLLCALALALAQPVLVTAQTGIINLTSGSSVALGSGNADSQLIPLAPGQTLSFGTCTLGNNSGVTVPTCVSTGPLTVTLYKQDFTVIPVANTATLSSTCPSNCGFTGYYYNPLSTNLSLFVRLTCEKNAQCNATLAFNTQAAAPPPFPPPPPPSPAPPSPPSPPPPKPPLPAYTCQSFQFTGPGATLFQICAVPVFQGIGTTLTTCPTSLSNVPNSACTGQTALTVYSDLASATAAAAATAIAYGDSTFNLNQACGGCADLGTLSSSVDPNWPPNTYNRTWYVRQECASFSTQACSGSLGYQYSFSPPPPSPPPPSPPPPSPPPTALAVLNSAIATVNFNLSLTGFTVATFGFTPAVGTGQPGVTGAALVVLNSVASQLNVPSYIVSFSSLISGGAAAGRHLLQGGVLATISLAALDSTTLATYVAAATALSSSPAALFAALTSGLTAAGFPGIQFVLSAPVVANNALNKISDIKLLCSSNAAACTGTTQLAFLNQVQSSTSLINLSATSISSVASTMATITGVGTLSAASQTVALNVLSGISGGGSAVQPDAAQAITQTLSNVASSGTGGTVTTALTGVLDSLTKSAAQSLTPNSPPLLLLSPTINSTVAVSNGSLPDPSAFNTPNCGVGTLPANALDSHSGGAVTTQFNSLAFDGNGGTNTNTMRFGFLTSSGAPIPVSNQPAPIVFNLPPVPPGGDTSLQAHCQYFDTASKTYMQQGCVGVPNPGPPGHTLNFVPNYATPDDNSLLMAWEITGPLVDGCCSFLLNCTDPEMADIQYPLDPYNAVGGTSVQCADISLPNPITGTKALRLFTGPNCGLNNPGNGAQCFWNATTQAFQGPGCVFDGPTQCMCRHLTDFASAKGPNTKTAALSSLAGINPGDIITKLQDLFAMVMVMWGVMNVGAFIGHGLDRGEKKKLLARLMRPECGFRLGPAGEWLWHLEHREMGKEVEAPEGTAVHLSAAFGMPFARLRTALPEELMPGKLAHAVGRKYGLSVRRLQEGQETQAATLQRIAQGLKSMATCGRRTRGGGADEEGSGHSVGGNSVHLAQGAPGPVEYEDPESGPAKPVVSQGDAVGTALVFAFILNSALLTPEELSNRFQASVRTLRNVPTGNQWGFQELYDKFAVMMSAGNLNAKEDWIERARLWRLFLSQNKDGSWDPSSSVAFSLLACSQEEAARTRGVPLRKFKWLADVAAMMEGDFDRRADFAGDEAVVADQLAEAAAHAPDRAGHANMMAFRAHAAESMRTKLREWQRVAKEMREERLQGRGFTLQEDEAPDCILTACPASICVTMPRSLRLAARGFAAKPVGGGEGDDPLLAAVGGSATASQHGGSEESEPTRRNLLGRLFNRGGAPIQGGSPGDQIRRIPNAQLMAPTPEASPHGSFREGAGGAGQPLSLMAQLQAMTAGLATERMLAQHLNSGAPDGRAAAPPAGEEQDKLFDSDDEVTPGPRRSIAPRSSITLRSGLALTAAPPAAVAAPEPVKAHFDALGVALAEKVWTTLLVLNVLQDQVEMLLFSDDTDPLERTVVDAARQWLDATAARFPLLQPLLEEEELPARAELVMSRWNLVIAHRVAELRRSEVVTQYMAVAHVQRIGGNLVHKVVTKHDTFSTFLKPPLDGLSRWQLFMILITLVMSGLMINIWMYYLRGSACCADVRNLLSCDPNPAPCRGFTGDCGDIPFQFNGMMFVDPIVQPQCVPVNPLIDYYCTAFPDDENPIDSFLVGLIAIAVALPVAIFCVSVFELSNEVQTPDAWLVWDAGPFQRLLLRGLNNDWHYSVAGPGTQPSRYVRWMARFYNNGEPFIRTWINLKRRAYAVATCQPVPWEDPPEEEGEEGEADSHASSQERREAKAEARAEAIKKRLLASFGVLGIMAAWLIFSVFVFYYGLLIYNTLGKAAEQQFTRSWGISYAMDNATQWQDIAKEAIRGIIILAILERLMLTRHGSWLDEHLDFYSIQAMLYTDKVVSFGTQIMMFFHFQKRIIDDD